MVDKRIGLPQGTLDLLILKVLSLGPGTDGRYRSDSTRSRLESCRCSRGLSPRLAPARA